MKTYIVGGIKLVGLVLFVKGLADIPRFVYAFGFAESYGMDQIVWAWPTVLWLTMGAVLFFKPHLVADRIACNRDDANLRKELTTLRIGVILIGLYFFISNLGILFRLVWNDISRIIYEPFWTSAAVALNVYIHLIPLYLIFGSERIVRWIVGTKKANEAAEQAV